MTAQAIAGRRYVSLYGRPVRGELTLPERRLGLRCVAWTVIVCAAAVPMYITTTASAANPAKGVSWSSKRIVVKFRRGFLDRAGAAPAGRRGVAAPRNPMSAAGRALANAARGWAVSNVRRAYPYEFRYPELAARYGLDRTYLMEVPSGTNTRAMAAAVRACSNDVESAAVDPFGHESCPPVDQIPDDPLYVDQYALQRIDALSAWGVPTDPLESVTIAIIDNGLNTGPDEHPEFAGRILQGINAAELGKPNESLTADVNGHGTHVAGIAAAEGCNAEGIAGISWGAYLLPVRIVPVGREPTASDAGNGLIWATDQSADICNVSQEFYIDPMEPTSLDSLKAAVGYAYDAGLLVVAAAGNRSENHAAYPARSAKCMAVSSTGATDLFSSSFSNFGCELDVAAPGELILSTWVFDPPTDPQYHILSGTSMSSPLVAGLAALMKSFNPLLTNVDLRNIINATAEDLGPLGWDNQFGYGRINAFRAMLAADPTSMKIVSSSPPSGAIDARIPVDSDGTKLGWQSIDITFDGDASFVSPDDFVVTQTGSNVACLAAGPAVSMVTPDTTDPATVTLTLARPIDPQSWIKVSYKGSGQAICLGMLPGNVANLPGDVSGNRRTEASDITELIQCLNGGPGACELWQCDIDRQGRCTGADLGTLVDLLNGAASFGGPWLSATLGFSPCAP